MFIKGIDSLDHLYSDFAAEVLSTALSESNFPVTALAVPGLVPCSDRLEILLCSSGMARLCQLNF